MAVLLLSVNLLIHQHQLHLHPTHMTDLPTYLPLPATRLVTVLTFRIEHLCLNAFQRGGEECPG